LLCFCFWVWNPYNIKSLTKNSAITNCPKLWGLLAKNQDFQKPKNWIITTWAFHVIMKFSSLKVSPSLNSTLYSKLALWTHLEENY
jgi:hypothetical protein